MLYFVINYIWFCCSFFCVRLPSFGLETSTRSYVTIIFVLRGFPVDFSDICLDFAGVSAVCSFAGTVNWGTGWRKHPFPRSSAAASNPCRAVIRGTDSWQEYVTIAPTSLASPTVPERTKHTSVLGIKVYGLTVGVRFRAVARLCLFALTRPDGSCTPSGCFLSSRYWNLLLEMELPRREADNSSSFRAEMNPLKIAFLLNNIRIRIQFVPHKKHITSPLQSPTC
jgi:hypothetical protein